MKNHSRDERTVGTSNTGTSESTTKTKNKSDGGNPLRQLKDTKIVTPEVMEESDPGSLDASFKSPG